jgi:hypothetical protein
LHSSSILPQLTTPSHLPVAENSSAFRSALSGGYFGPLSSINPHYSNSVLASRQPQSSFPLGSLLGTAPSSLGVSNTRQSLFGNNPAGSGSLFGRLLPVTPSNPAPNAGTLLGDISVPFSISPHNLPAGKPAASATAHRNALIHLLHMSEKICFSALFNAAFRPNILVEVGSACLSQLNTQSLPTCARATRPLFAEWQWNTSLALRA